MSETLQTALLLAPEISVDDDLMLRLMEPSDHEEIFQILQEAPEIQSYVTWTGRVKSAQDVARAIEQFRENNASRYSLVNDGTVVGYAGVYPYEEGVYGLGYFCRPASRGRGYITRAVTVLMEQAAEVLPVDTFALYIADENTASKAIAARLGFEATETLFKDPILQRTERLYERSVRND